MHSISINTVYYSASTNYFLLRIVALKTRALSSTKPSARCMALATFFNSCMQKRVQLKGWGQGETGPMMLMLLA